MQSPKRHPPDPYSWSYWCTGMRVQATNNTRSSLGRDVNHRSGCATYRSGCGTSDTQKGLAQQYRPRSNEWICDRRHSGFIAVMGSFFVYLPLPRLESSAVPYMVPWQPNLPRNGSKPSRPSRRYFSILKYSNEFPTMSLILPEARLPTEISEWKTNILYSRTRKLGTVHSPVEA